MSVIAVHKARDFVLMMISQKLAKTKIRLVHII